MTTAPPARPTPPPQETTAFAVWLGRALRRSHAADAVHEPIPDELLAMLPPPNAER